MTDKFHNNIAYVSYLLIRQNKGPLQNRNERLLGRFQGAPPFSIGESQNSFCS
jgi:hypothetical protein